MLRNGCPATGALCCDTGVAGDVCWVTFRTGAYGRLSGGPHAVTSSRDSPASRPAMWLWNELGVEGFWLGFSEPANDPIAKPRQAVKDHQGCSLWLVNPILQHTVAGPKSRI